MAVVYVRGSGMTSDDNGEDSSSVSAEKEESEYRFPNGESFAVVTGNLDAVQKSDLARKVKFWEKDSLIERKISGELLGVIRDTRNRYGDPKEWDHLQFMLDREESEVFSRTDLARAKDIIASNAGKDISGRFQKMVITRIHTDTGNSHVDVLIHRHPFDPATNTTMPSDELTNRSRLSALVEKINAELLGAGLPGIKDVKKQDGQSLYEESATSEAAKHVVNAMVSDEGGIPNQRTGAPMVPDEGAPRLAMQRIQDPDTKILQKMVLDAERDAKAAAQRFVSAQNALAAQLDREELRTKLEAANADIVARDEALETARVAKAAADAEAAATLAERDAAIEAGRNREVELQSHAAGLSITIDGQAGRINGLENDYDTAQAEIAELDAAIESLQGKVTQQQTAIEDRDTTIAARQADIEALNVSLSDANATVSKQADDIETLTTQVTESTATIAKQAGEIEALTTQATAAQAMLAKQSSDIETLTTQATAAQAAVAKQADEIEKLRARLHQKDMEIARSTGAIESRDQQIVQAIAERDEARRAAAIAEPQVQALTTKLQEKEIYLSAVEAKLQSAKKEAITNTSERLSMMSAVSQHVPESKRGSLRDAITALVEKLTQLVTQKAKDDQKIADLVERAEEMKKEQAALAAKLSETEKMNGEMRGYITTLQKQFGEGDDDQNDETITPQVPK